MNQESNWSQILQSIGWVDGVALAVLLWFFIRGIWKGFVWQVAGILALVGGLLAAKALAPHVAPTVSSVFPKFSQESGLDLVASYFFVFVAVMLVVWLVARLLKGLIDKLRLSSFDRLLGGVFGAVKAAGIIVIAVSFLSTLNLRPLKENIAKAKTGQYTEIALEKGMPLFPEPLVEKVKETMEGLADNLPFPGATPESGEAEGAPLKETLQDALKEFEDSLQGEAKENEDGEPEDR